MFDPRIISHYTGYSIALPKSELTTNLDSTPMTEGHKYGQLIAGLFLLLFWPLQAQWRGPLFDVFDSKDGLPSNYIWSICQDSTGFIYFALSDQLVRYDGRTFKDYFHHPNDTHSIGPGQINKMIYSSKTGKIWMAMRRDGLNSFDPVTEKFNHYGQFISNYIFEDSSGLIWLGNSQSELLQFDPRTEKFKIYSPDSSSGLNIPNSTILTILPDRNDANYLWLSYLDLLPDPSKPIPEQLIHFNKTSGQFIPVPCHGAAYYQNQQGQLFSGSWLHGLWRYDPIDQSCIWMDLDTTFPTGLSTNSGAFSVNQINRKYWVSSRQAIFEFNDDLKPEPIFYLEDMVTFGTIFKDNSKNIWVTSNAGLYVMSPRKQKIDFFNLNQFGIPNRIYPGRLAHFRKNNVIYLAGDSCIFEIPLNKFSPARKLLAPSDPTGIAVDENDRIWVALEDGHFYLLNPDTKSLIRANKLGWPEIEINRLWQLVCFEGHYLIGISSNDVYWMDTRNPGWKVKHHPREPPLTFAHNRIARTNDGSYLLSYGPEVIEIDLASGIEHRLNSGGTCIQHPDGDYWVIDINHLAVYSRIGDSLILKRYYTPADDGIHVGSGYMIHVDYRKRVWVFGESGISVIDPATDQIHNVGVTDGLVTTTIDPIQVVELPDHRLVMPNGNGIIVFDPDQLWEATSAPYGPVLINEVRVNGKSIPHALIRKKELELSPNQNTLEFEFQTLSYPTDRNITYAYQVKNLSEGWQSIGRSNLVTLAQIPPGSYDLQLKTGSKRNGPVTNFYFLIRAPFYRKPSFLVTLTLMSLGGILLLYRRRIKNIRKIEAEKLIHHKQIAELELQTLRAQMNPHFMFNSLNSIKNYILKNDRERSAEYLSNFAHLIRMILQNSREKLITLQQELDTLLLYIELERVRFREGFSFSCEIDESIDLNEVFLPPMIIIPYVENAIWHGLLHKEDNRHLSITICRDKTRVCCIINDNGIGRIKASELKSKSATPYKSMGMSITSDRIALINTINSMNITVEITDIYSLENQPAGTTVKITIPYENNFN